MGIITAVAIVVAAIILALDKFGLLERFGLVHQEKSAGDWKNELELADRRVERLTAERDRVREERDLLQRTRSIEPVLEQLAQNAKNQARVLEKLATFNGSLKQLELGLHEATEALKFVAGLVTSDVASDRPTTRTRRRTT